MDSTNRNGTGPISTQIAITATSRRCCGLANSIVEQVTSHGGHICEIQMYEVELHFHRVVPLDRGKDPLLEDQSRVASPPDPARMEHVQ